MMSKEMLNKEKNKGDQVGGISWEGPLGGISWEGSDGGQLGGIAYAKGCGRRDPTAGSNHNQA